MKRKLCMLLASVLCIGMLAGCGSEEKKEQGVKEEKTVLKLGASPLTTKLIESAVPELEKMGYKVEVKTFDDFVLPNTALSEGSLDANIYQHEPYLDAYNEKNGTNLVMIDRLAFTPMGIYSDKVDKLQNIPEGATVGIYQDASNQDRALRVLANNDLIKLKKKDGLYSLLDIEENPKNLEFKTMDINQLIKGIGDLDIIFSPAVNMFLSGTKPKYELATEKPDKDNLKYSVVLVVREEDKNANWVKDILEAYRSDDTRKREEKAFDGTFNIIIDQGK